MSALPPGSVIGVLGGGQLGQMLALAAAPLGYRVHVYSDRPGPATQVCPLQTVAPYTELAALDAFAAAVDVVTCEFENVPAAAAERLAASVPVRPGPRALATCQDRVAEKTLLRELGVPTAPWGRAESAADVARLARELGRPCILKTARMGYDGKGQARIREGSDPAAAWAEAMGHAPGVLGVVEGFVDFDCEISVIVARGLPDAAGAVPVATYEPVRNMHAGGILRRTQAPAGVAPEVAREAVRLARMVADELDIVGLLAVEMFVEPGGGLRVNELAARPHNSGHWSQDGAVTSQFEQCVRAICGLPLGSTARTGRTVMHNLIGEEVHGAQDWLARPGAHLHLYGKAEVRPGRKLGHVNVVAPEGG